MSSCATLPARDVIAIDDDSDVETPVAVQSTMEAKRGKDTKKGGGRNPLAKSEVAMAVQEAAKASDRAPVNKRGRGRPWKAKKEEEEEEEAESVRDRLRREGSGRDVPACPMCGRQFHLLSTLQEHADECAGRQEANKKKMKKQPVPLRKSKRKREVGEDVRPRKRRAAKKEWAEEWDMLSDRESDERDESDESDVGEARYERGVDAEEKAAQPASRARSYPLKEELLEIPFAPTFRPTPEEWENPYQYINAIRAEAQKAGICKIIPPTALSSTEHYSFDDVVDENKFRFETKRQYIHLLLRRGSCQSFLKCLAEFRKEELGLPLPTELPMIGRTPVNLYVLYRAVNERGGLSQFHNLTVWREVAAVLGLSHCSERDLQELSNIYADFLSTFAASGRGDAALKMCGDQADTVPGLSQDSNGEKDWGFGEGGKHNLRRFRERADRFFHHWFGREQVTLEEIESAFWDIVETGSEPCVVEYGSDLDVVQHGSGFPKDIALSGWNLTHLPTYNGSLFQHLRSHIAGVTIPMMYVGMVFSSFCWHTEDNHLFSINYNHKGAAKLWYGVPGHESLKFEELMRAALPTLFSNEPDLLHKLVTMFSPIELHKKGIHVVRSYQHEGEYVITFPRAYHGGLNAGFNVAEAVNFATEDWLGYGAECVKMYAQVKRASVFSFPELVYDALRSSALRSVHADRLLLKMFKVLREHEGEERDQLVKQGLRKCARWHTDTLPRSLPCSVCEAECFFSTVVCDCAEARGRNACLRHGVQLCSCETLRKVLWMRLTLKQMDEIIERHSEKQKRKALIMV